MRIAIIGSTQYEKDMIPHRCLLLDEGHEVALPAFDACDGDELHVCSVNRNHIEWADEIHLFWDGRSLGTIFDLGMAFALRKPIKVIYLEPKDFRNFVRQYENSGK